MTAAADRLRTLAAEATPGPWLVMHDDGDGLEIVRYPDDLTYVVQLSDSDEDDARLIALAPELALLCADMADTLEKHGSAMPHGQYVNHAEADALLARLAALSDTQEPA